MLEDYKALLAVLRMLKLDKLDSFMTVQSSTPVRELQ